MTTYKTIVNFASTLFIIFLLSISHVAASEVTDTKAPSQELAVLLKQMASLNDYNQSSKARLLEIKAFVHKQRQQSASDQKTITEKQLDLTEINHSLAQAELMRISQVLRDAKFEISQTEIVIRKLEEQFHDFKVSSDKSDALLKTIDSLKSRIQEKRKLHASYIDQLKLLQEAYDYALQLVDLQGQYLKLLQERYKQQQQLARKTKLEQFTEQTKRQQQAWLDQLIKVNKQLAQLGDEPLSLSDEAVRLGISAFHLDEKIKLSQLSLQITRLLQVSEEMPRLSLIANQPSKVSAQSTKISRLIRDLEIIRGTIHENIDLIEHHQTILKQSEEHRVITKEQFNSNNIKLVGILKEYKQLQDKTVNLQKKFSEYHQGLQKYLPQIVSKRQGVPGWDKDSWLLLLNETANIPQKTLQYFYALRDHAIGKFQSFQTYQLFVLALIIFSAISLWFLGRFYTLVLINSVEERRQRISANFVYIVAQLLRRNLGSLIFFATSLLIALYSAMSFKFYAVFLYLLVVWIIFHVIIGLARLSLLERISDTSGDDVRLYHRLKWNFFIGGIITLLTVLAHQLAVAEQVRDLFTRLSMLFLLGVSIVLLKGYKVVPSLIQPYIDKRRLYLQRAIHLLFIFIPLTLMTDAIIGVLGYIDLAWAISYYQLMLLLVITLYVVVRGLLIDLIDLASESAIRYLKNGWLWSEAILKPIDRIFRVIIFLSALLLLFIFYGWDEQSMVILKLSTLLNYPLLNLSVGKITILSSLEFIALVIIFIWATRWIKEFAYRWLFRKTRDASLRYSLSVFSQYAMVTIGTVVTLRVLGIDFSGMAMILGGVAIGLSFALRDFANNVLSGLVLLVERPVREGDKVTVGDCEGEIIHIGLRSSKMRSWDNLEVMVPNAELVNKMFLNWTHQDDIARTVVPIKTQRTSDPTAVQKLMLKVLASISEVLAEPGPQVLLQKLDEGLAEFEVRYFINLAQHTRPVVQSIVLFALWENFKKHGIQPAYPQRDIHIKEFPAKL